MLLKKTDSALCSAADGTGDEHAGVWKPTGIHRNGLNCLEDKGGTHFNWKEK